MKINKSFILKRILPIFGGAILGYAYYYFIGCTSGTCAITSNPYISTIYGAVVGATISFPNKKEKNENERKENFEGNSN